MAAAVALIAYCAPDDADQGLSQKIFYFHVPMALRAYACVLLVELAGKRIDLRLREFKGVARVTAAEQYLAAAYRVLFVLVLAYA